MSCNVNAACGCVGERMGNTRAVADYIKPLMAGLEVLCDVDLHIVELDLNAVKESVIVGGSGSYLIERIDHLDYSVEYALRKHEAEVTGRCLERGRDKRFVDTALS